MIAELSGFDLRLWPLAESHQTSLVNMSGLGKVMKEGWHPKGKDGGKESWRSDFKGINQVVGNFLSDLY